jgi:hypothetical protein
VVLGEFHQRLDLLGALWKHGGEWLLGVRFRFLSRVRYEAASEAFFEGFEGFFGDVTHKTPFHRPCAPVHTDHALDG